MSRKKKYTTDMVEVFATAIVWIVAFPIALIWYLAKRSKE